MQPEISINYLAIVLCVLVALPVGFLWFGPLFGKSWAKLMGLEGIEQPGGAAMARSMLVYAFGSLLIAWVLVHSIEVWRPSAWNAGADNARPRRLGAEAVGTRRHQREFRFDSPDDLWPDLGLLAVGGATAWLMNPTILAPHS